MKAQTVRARRYRQLRRHRRRMGLCTWCGKPSAPWRLCFECKLTPSYNNYDYVPVGLYRCGVCRQPGHNARRCPEAEPARSAG